MLITRHMDTDVNMRIRQVIELDGSRLYEVTVNKKLMRKSKDFVEVKDYAVATWRWLTGLDIYINKTDVDSETVIAAYCTIEAVHTDEVGDKKYQAVPTSDISTW